MIKMRDLLLFCFFTIGSVVGNAQQLSVDCFKMDEFDLSAISEGSVVLDKNNQKCALIKVECPIGNLTFNTGKLGVVKTISKFGETWVYVPEGVSQISISHKDYGSLKNINLGMVLKRGKTYIMQLTPSIGGDEDHKAWYIIGTQKELVEKEILVNGFLNKFDKQKFIPIKDFRSVDRIALPNNYIIPDRPRKKGPMRYILPPRVEGSYSISWDNGNLYLTIHDPALFWQDFNYLVVVYKEAEFDNPPVSVPIQAP